MNDFSAKKLIAGIVFALSTFVLASCSNADAEVSNVNSKIVNSVDSEDSKLSSSEKKAVASVAGNFLNYISSFDSDVDYENQLDITPYVVSPTEENTKLVQDFSLGTMEVIAIDKDAYFEIDASKVQVSQDGKSATLPGDGIIYHMDATNFIEFAKGWGAEISSNLTEKGNYVNYKFSPSYEMSFEKVGDSWLVVSESLVPFEDEINDFGDKFIAY